MFDVSYLIGYIILLILIGYFSGRKQSGDEFMIANRQLGLFEFVSTIVATLVGGTVLVVYTAYTYVYGIVTLLGFVGATLGFIFFAYIAKNLRKIGKENNFHTVADFFHFKYGKKLGHLVAMIIFTVILIAILKQFISGTQILAALSGFSYEASLAITATVILLYLVMGGFQSVVKTDVFQYLVVLFLIFVVGVMSFKKAEVPVNELLQLDASDPKLLTSFLLIGSLSVWHAADVWQRVYAAKNDKIIKQGFFISGIVILILGAGITMIGLAARNAFPDIDSSQALVFGMTNLLPPGVLGLGVVLLFAAIMSSADTLLFVLATSFAKDFVSQRKGIEPNEDELRAYTRIGIMFIVLLVSLLTYFFRDVVHIALVNVGLGFSLTPSIIGSFIGDLNPKAVLISVLSALLYWLVWVLLGHIDPNTMTSVLLVSTTTLIIAQKVIKNSNNG